MHILSDGVINIDTITAGADASIGNGSHGAYLDNTTGTASDISITGTGLFKSNALDGLYALSDGAISLNTTTASNNTNYGAYLDNTSGTGAVTFNSTGTFENYSNQSSLYVLSKGAINSTSSLSANSNGVDGARVDNSSGAGYIQFTGNNIFNGNINNGLSAYSTGLITLSSTNANGNQNGFGAYLNTNGNDVIVNSSTFENNNLAGLSIVAQNFYINYSTANLNGTDGFSLQAMENGEVICIRANDNAGLGVFANVIRKFHINDLSLTGNGARAYGGSYGELGLSHCYIPIRLQKLYGDSFGSS